MRSNLHRRWKLVDSISHAVYLILDVPFVLAWHVFCEDGSIDLTVYILSIYFPFLHEHSKSL